MNKERNEGLVLAGTPVKIEFGDAIAEWDRASVHEVDDGSVSVHFADGSIAVFYAVWHNDSTAGLYLQVKEPA